MRVVIRLFAILIVLTSVISTHGQWIVAKRLAPKTYRTINVDVPPSNEERSPIVMSSSFVDDMNGWAACDDGTLLQTTDGGKNWNHRTIYPRVNDTPSMFFNSIGVFFTSSSSGWLIATYEGKSTILRTTDGGNRWTVNYTVTNGALHNIWFVDERVGWAVGEFEDRTPFKSGGLILGTKDGGKTWKTQHREDGEESFLHEIRFNDERNGWAVGDNVIFHTNDGGKVWSRQKREEIDGYLFGLAVISNTEVWAVGSSGKILHTSNSGKTWKEVKLAPELDDPWLNSVHFVNQKRGWIAGNNGLILATENGGQSWTVESKDESSYWRNLNSTKNHIFAFGNDGIVFRREL